VSGIEIGGRWKSSMEWRLHQALPQVEILNESDDGVGPAQAFLCTFGTLKMSGGPMKLSWG
jgi:hypothetical protein